MKRNLWLVIGYHENPALGYRYDHKTRGLGIPLGVYSTEELAREVGEAYARDEEGTFIGPRSYTMHRVKLDVGASICGLGDWVFQPALRTAGYPAVTRGKVRRFAGGA